ncbi:ABC transporter permease [Chitinibacter sp. S2-10]|uniref:ABC transporter permease n=1 Tax=Chitinibacter sp. S2-10 TaxID=3373597 RepID=UPI003977E01E
MKHRLKACTALAWGNARIVATDKRGRAILTLGYLLGMWLLYYLWQALYAGNDRHAGMNFSTALLHVATAQTLFAVLQAFGDWRLAREIRSGEVATALTQPVSLPLRHAAMSLGRVLAQAAYFLPAFGAFLLWAGLRLTPSSWLLAIASIALSFVLLFCIDFVVGLAGFIATDLWGITASKDVVVQFLGGALIPLAFLPAGAQAILHWLPFAHFFNTPVSYLTGQMSDITPLLIQAVWALLFVGAANWASRVIQRRLVIFGA